MTVERTLLQKIIAIFYPERCAGCANVVVCGHLICETCKTELVYVGSNKLCLNCGRQKQYCRCSGRGYRYVDQLISPFYYEGPVKSAILRLKLNKKQYVAEFLHKNMVKSIKTYYNNIKFDMIVPVPIYYKTVKERGFNQSQLLAKGISDELNIPIIPALSKLYETLPQRQLPANRRSGNILGVFEPNFDINIKNKIILLVDDVSTTGSTISECAKMLLIHNAAKVFAITAAVAKPPEKSD